MAPNDAFSSNRKLKRSASAECIRMKKIEASPHYQLRSRSLSGYSNKAANNDTANAATVGQGHLREKNIQKTDTVPSPILKPNEAAGVNHAKLSGQQLVGHKVKIWWPEKKMFHTGKITDFNKEAGVHMVHYDNDIKEVVDLDKERWQLVQEKDIVAGPSNTTIKWVEVNSFPVLKRKVMDITHEGQRKKFTKTELHSNEDLAIYPKKLLLLGQNWPMLHLRCGLFFQNMAILLATAPCMRIGFLEAVCNVVEKLRSTEFGFTSSQLGEMNRAISLAAMANLNVSWLQSFLGKINAVDEVVTQLRASTYRLVQAAGKDVDDWKQRNDGKHSFASMQRWKVITWLRSRRLRGAWPS